jgi:hypothetical protein
MAGKVTNRKLLHQRRQQCSKGFILGRLEAVALQPFKFYANGEVVAVVSTGKLRWTGVPGAVVAADELPQVAATLDKKVG